MFNIDFAKLINNLLPHFLRGAKMKAWLESLLKPVVDLYDSLLAYRDEKLYEAQITGQVDSLEKMLNDAFPAGDSGARPIYITDIDDYTEDILIFNTAEYESETWLYNTAEAETETLIYNGTEGQSSFDFLVYIDVALPYDLDLMISLINKYKLSGTTYQIITVQ